MRDEVLNETLFFGLDQARAKIADWVADYNSQRSHSSLGYLTPAAYAANLTATYGRLRNPGQLCRSHPRAERRNIRRYSNRHWLKLSRRVSRIANHSPR
jgi:hypothetical protein